MEGEGNGSLCILCCYSFPHLKTEGENADGPFLQFCEQLLSGNKEMIVDLAMLKSSGHPVCPSCVEHVGEVSKQRRETADLEDLLIKQQLEVVVTMKRLQDQVQRIQTEMKRMEDTVKNSDVAVLDRVLEREEMEGCRSAIVMLRNKILTASGEIENFGIGVARKLPGKAKSKKKKAVDPLDFLDLNMKTEGNMEEEEMIDLDELLGSDSDDDYEQKYDIFDEDYQPEVGIGIGDSDYVTSEEEGEKSETEKPVVDENGELIPSPKKKNKKRKRKPDDNGPEEAPSPKKKKWKRKTIDFTSIVKKMSELKEFKLKIVKRILTLKDMKEKRDFKEPAETSKAPNYFIESPSKNYAIDYDPLTDKITLGHVELLLNEHLKSFTCGECRFVTTLEKCQNNPSYLIRSIFYHVLGKHLEAFKCAECGKVLTTKIRYRYHIRAHQNEFACDICGRQLSEKRVLDFHKWNIHMTEEERTIAIANGQKAPQECIWLEKKKEREKLRLHQCPTCGKGFENSFVLKVHMKTHLDREDREKIVCPKCGKHLLKSGWHYHSKVACAEGLNLLYCDQCPEDKRKPFKSAMLLKKHVERLHTVSDVTFYCDVCGKGCKTKICLKAHMKTHSDARPYYCQKGCGANYKASKHCRRHELKCEGGEGSWKGPRSTKTIK